MKIVRKNVFYCDYCRKHGLSRPAMEKHELHCTLNPDRVCRWMLLDYPAYRRAPETHQMRPGLPRWIRIFAPLEERHLDRLREHALGCPACMLAAIRLSGIDRMSGFHFTCRWDYEEEVKRYREEERESWVTEERRAIEATFL